MDMLKDKSKWDHIKQLKSEKVAKEWIIIIIGQQIENSLKYGNY